jgi:hypothetical protein
VQEIDACFTHGSRYALRGAEQQEAFHHRESPTRQSRNPNRIVSRKQGKNAQPAENGSGDHNGGD